MAINLRANTAVDVLIGPFVDLTNGSTSEAGETPAIVLSKNGQALTAKNDITVPVYDSVGYYNCELDTTDTNTEGSLVLVAPVTATALPVRHEYNVMAEAAWDSLYVAKDDGFIDVNIKTVGRADTQETEANNLESACANYSATRGLTGTSLPAIAGGGAGGVVLGSAANSLAVDAAGKVAVPDTQKVDVETIKAQAVTCGAAVTIRADVGAASIVPTNTQFEARTLPSADYVVVGDTIAGVTGMAIETKQDTAKTVIDNISTAVITNATGTDIAADIIALRTVANTIATDTTTDIPLTITTMQGNITTIMADTDLLDDAIGGLADIHTDVGTAITQASEANAHTHSIDLVTTKLDTALVADALVYQFTANALELAPSVTAIWDHVGSITSISVELLLERLYEMVNNKMIVTEATGGVALRNLADGADVATGNVQDLGATTVRSGLTWV